MLRGAHRCSASEPSGVRVNPGPAGGTTARLESVCEALLATRGYYSQRYGKSSHRPQLKFIVRQACAPRLMKTATEKPRQLHRWGSAARFNDAPQPGRHVQQTAHCVMNVPAACATVFRIPGVRHVCYIHRQPVLDKRSLGEMR